MPRTPGIARTFGTNPAGKAGIEVIGPPDGVSRKYCWANTSWAAAPPTGVPLKATIVVMTPTATLVTNSARTRPLIARKPACGLSASRRPAMSTAGRFVRRYISREPIMVNHGPAMTSPATITNIPPT